MSQLVTLPELKKIHRVLDRRSGSWQFEEQPGRPVRWFLHYLNKPLYRPSARLKRCNIPAIQAIRLISRANKGKVHMATDSVHCDYPKD